MSETKNEAIVTMKDINLKTVTSMQKAMKITSTKLCVKQFKIFMAITYLHLPKVFFVPHNHSHLNSVTYQHHLQFLLQS